MYGQNKQGEALDAISQHKKTVKVFDIYVDTDSPDDNADTGITIPANSVITSATITNLGPTALASGAKTLDIVCADTNATDLTASAASLAVGVSVAMAATLVPVYVRAATNILVDGNIYTGSSYTTLRVAIEYITFDDGDQPEVIFGAGGS